MPKQPTPAYTTILVTKELKKRLDHIATMENRKVNLQLKQWCDEWEKNNE